MCRYKQVSNVWHIVNIPRFSLPRKVLHLFTLGMVPPSGASRMQTQCYGLTYLFDTKVATKVGAIRTCSDIISQTRNHLHSIAHTPYLPCQQGEMKAILLLRSQKRQLNCNLI
jgi:hypothetical protein